MTDERHPPRRESGTPPRRGIAIYSPIEGGFRGVCLSQFFLFIFIHSLIYRIDRHAALAAPVEDEKPRFDMPCHVATLIGRNKLRPTIF